MADGIQTVRPSHDIARIQKEGGDFSDRSSSSSFDSKAAALASTSSWKIQPMLDPFGAPTELQTLPTESQPSINSSSEGFLSQTSTAPLTEVLPPLPLITLSSNVVEEEDAVVTIHDDDDDEVSVDVHSRSTEPQLSFDTSFGLEHTPRRSATRSRAVSTSSATQTTSKRMLGTRTADFIDSRPSHTSFASFDDDESLESFSRHPLAHLHSLNFGAELHSIFLDLQKDFEKDLRKEFKKITKLQQKYIRKVDEVLCFVLEQEIKKKQETREK